MELRAAIEQFISAPGDQYYGDDRQPLQTAHDHAKPAGNAVARAAGDASDLFRGVPVELGALARFVRTNFHSDSPNEKRDQTTLIAALSGALLTAGARPREVGADHGLFNEGIEIDTSHAELSPPPPLRADPAVSGALAALIERSPGRQWTGGSSSIETERGAVPHAVDQLALKYQVYSTYTTLPNWADDPPETSRAFLRTAIAADFVHQGDSDRRLDPAAMEVLIDELLAYAKRSVD